MSRTGHHCRRRNRTLTKVRVLRSELDRENGIYGGSLSTAINTGARVIIKTDGVELQKLALRLHCGADVQKAARSAMIC